MKLKTALRNRSDRLFCTVAATVLVPIYPVLAITSDPGTEYVVSLDFQADELIVTGPVPRQLVKDDCWRVTTTRSRYCVTAAQWDDFAVGDTFTL